MASSKKNPVPPMPPKAAKLAAKAKAIGGKKPMFGKKKAKAGA